MLPLKIEIRYSRIRINKLLRLYFNKFGDCGIDSQSDQNNFLLIDQGLEFWMLWEYCTPVYT